jgi:hypothetical protein
MVKRRRRRRKDRGREKGREGERICYPSQQLDVE